MKRALYWSFNEAEMALMLGTLDADEALLYMALKKRSNFRTGEVGTFKNEHLTLQKLADTMARPSRQGKLATVYHRKEILRMLDRLRDRGLVADTQDQADRLTLRLPLSPMRTPAEVATARTEVDGSGLPLDDTPHALEGPVNTRVSGDSLDGSVLTRSTLDQSSSSSNGSSGGMDDGAGCAGASSHRDDQEHKPEPKRNVRGITTTQMEARLRQGGFRLLGYEYSRQLLQEWEAMGLSGEDFNIAASVVEGDTSLDRVPAALDLVLRPRTHRRATPGRGRVAL